MKIGAALFDSKSEYDEDGRLVSEIIYEAKPALNAVQKIRAIVVLNGGPGSGFTREAGHKGRIGKVGGSTPSDAGEDEGWIPSISKSDRNLIERASEENANDNFNASEKNRLSKIISKQKPLSEDMVVYRGVDPTDENQWYGPNAKWISEQFTSASTNRDAARRYGEKVIAIRIPKGSRVLVYADYGYWGNDEVLIDRGSKYIAESASKWKVVANSSLLSLEQKIRAIMVLNGGKGSGFYGHEGREGLEDKIKINFALRRTQLALRNPTVVANGGQGSGNFGHEGRPGEVGGSVDDGTNSISTSLESLKKSAMEKASRIAGAQDNMDIPEMNARAIFRYKDESYQRINENLRAGMGDNAGYEVEYIDYTMKKSKIPENVTVFRGVSDPSYKSLEVGDAFTDKAYVSTSFDFNFAKDFSGGNGGTILIIDAKAGSKGLFTDNILSRDENELLFPRNSRFTVTEKFSKDGIDYIRMTKK